MTRDRAQDSTHLCEFHQVEGLVADYDLNLGNLKCIIRTFFAEIGITQLRFKPAFNPYTEPSMEVRRSESRKGDELRRRVLDKTTAGR